MASLTRRLFVEMLREEWRLHSDRFSGGRLAAFPLLIAALTAGTTLAFVWSGTDPATILTGALALVFVFGLHTGSIGLVGRDALANLFGELTLLVFSARTLPVSQGRLLAVFVCKDVVFYALLFLGPLAVGSVPVLLALTAVPAGAPTTLAALGSLSPTALLAVVPATLWLWAALLATFALGLGTTLAVLGLVGRGRAGTAIVAGAFAVGLAAAAVGVDIAAYTPFGLVPTPTAAALGGTAGLLVGVFGLAAATFDVTGRRPARQAAPAFRRWNRRLGEPITTKTLLEVHRSAGGFGKLVFSALLLFVVTAGLVDLAGRITGVAPSVGVSFGAILGLSGFTTYNWLTQFDDIETYLPHPVGVERVFAAKSRAFVLLGPPVGLAFYALALAWRGSPLGEALVGAVVLVGVTGYIFGTTIYLTGLSPNEFLFDTALFGLFGLAMIVPLVPILVVAFALTPLSTGLLAGLGTLGVVLAVVGAGLYRRSKPRWNARYRRG